MTADPLADDITQAASCLGGDGLLAGEVQGFAARPQQQEMAAAVEQALADASTLIVEAGTGTGKTFAYLVPALLSGKKVIIKVSEKLKDIPHQVIVAGFTDNIPIRGGLTKKFPTNWELAGARAASVVRLLEKQGIDNGKLTAVSYGENQPVASNDSADGRSQNRRIEIRLKPVE